MKSSSEFQPAGFFDSGVGGLTVLEAFRERVGDLDFHYLADTAHCPYGDRPLKEVRRFALASTEFLVEQGCETVVMACNISSSVALDAARQRFPDKNIYGLVNPSLAESVRQQSSQGNVGVLATSGTVKSQRYLDQLEEVGLNVIQQACSPLVPLIESGHLSGPLVKQTLQPLLEPLKKAEVDTVILGCTHYPFLVPVLEQLLSSDVKIVDPANILAERLAVELTDGEADGGPQKYWATGEQESLYHLFAELYPAETIDIHSAQLKGIAEQE